MPRTSATSLALCLLALLSLTLCGCGPRREKTYRVEGEVVFADGSHVKVGTIETKSLKTGTQARGSIDSDGRFSLTTYEPNDGAVAGDHQVVIVQFIQVEGIKNYRPSTLGVVNKKHASYATSGLVLQVDPKGPNRIRIEVEGARTLPNATKDHGHDPISEPTPPEPSSP